MRHRRPWFMRVAFPILFILRTLSKGLSRPLFFCVPDTV